MQRRTLFSGLSAALITAACGFELRRPPALPFRSIMLRGFAPQSPLAAELRRALTEQVELVQSAAQAEVVLHALTDAREKTVVASTSAGQVRELQLRVRLRFRLLSQADEELLAPVELLLTRDMSYTEGSALAKEKEEAQLYVAMDSDIVSQVLRRLAAVKRP